ncbi:diguanylate cyclase [bacterium]|nr:diguanylate cyclase [bacterium]
MKKFLNKKVKVFLLSFVLFAAILSAIVVFVKNTGINEFITSMENSSFDLRQKVLASSKNDKVNKDLVILTIDDASYEYLHEKYGEWPLPRSVYANLVNYIEKQNPKVIAFDLMFVKPMKNAPQDDIALVKSITSNDNVYAAMNFDDQEADVRTPIDLDNKFKVNVQNNSKVDFSQDLTFTNCRSILPQLMSGTPNIASVNVSRSTDGYLRKLPPLMKYKGEFYPHLALKVGLKAKDVQSKDFQIDKNGNLITELGKIPLDKTGGAILNWYGTADKTFTMVPLYKVVKAMNGEIDSPIDFNNKIIYIGTTAVSLYDTKTVPVDKLYPGVAIHTTFINNLLDGNFIKRTSTSVDIALSLILAALVGFIIFKSPTTLMSISFTMLTTLIYIIFAYYMMKFFNVWVAIVMPAATILVMLILTYVVKYILKSRDFENQYKLATIDGLTELYNHRYFQEQMLLQVTNCKRYNTHFSMIIIDIDFFKKFNDVYGHQSGDAVLKQVAAKLKKNVRSCDIVCRYGGEEMTIILPNTDYEEAIITAEKICHLIAEKPFKLVNNQESNVTISLGVATYPQDGDAPAQIIENADKRLYVAKENGRNQVGK